VEERFSRTVLVERLQTLALAEVKALQGVLDCPEDVRMHSCGVSVV
jgi:tRNA-(ms[2]io[6]A)-hydroxylase